ncbi:protein NETWORKED 4B [Solanum lycopersicum]|uniref:NAB domain-containing protein n=1 Tax=Solanum lycopersicum TaxID=4081 RepID=A0A3Q7FLU4_SOLLC|nr:protein NETWORKED 4B [Solanum lycopersicum]XP_010318226.1 protein NETWORKED 4B [Solanum lycopersicum]XP_025885775.1 protein NETWORKED 4B [Solanum lycopersicum]
MKNVIEQDEVYYSAVKGPYQLNEDICPASPPMQLSEYTAAFQHGSNLLTPKQKLVCNDAADLALLSNSSASSCSSSSGISAKEGFDSLSLTPEFDSESYSSSPDEHQKSALGGVKTTLQEDYLEMESKEENGYGIDHESLDCTSKLREDREYEMVLNSIMDQEHKLSVPDQKIQFSEEEIQGLKYELERNEAVAKLVVFLKVQLDTARSEVMLQKDDLEMERSTIQELQKQVALLESQISNSDFKIERWESELEMNREKLEASEEEVAKLKHDCSKVINDNTCYLADQLELTQEELILLKGKLESEERLTSELHEGIMRYKADISDCDQEIRRINAVLEEAQQNFCMQKEQFQSQMTSLSEQQAVLEARTEQLEMQNRSLERKASQCGAQMVEMKTLHEVQEIKWKAEIECLKMEINKKGEEVQGLNKDLDKLKLDYDTVVAEKDEEHAKVQTLGAEVMSRDIQIQEMEDHLKQLIAGSESAQKSIEELRLKVEELQNEVERQTLVISDRAEEKREAIRQLCFSLEHYRTGYKELLQDCVQRRRHAVIAA